MNSIKRRLFRWHCITIIILWVGFAHGNEGAFRITDVATNSTLALAKPPEGDHSLIAGRSWRVESTWYSLSRPDAGPIHTQVLQTHENGVVSRMLIDLGIIVADARLIEVKSLPEPTC